ncbi:MAG: glycosyltransferase family 1 protein [Planctomycetota bacterium]|nr:MAG: glycosyltransferase family 1 protein [Planctomycetota bacterium]REJ87957.1 MAG: glycosyltransferase family 1 protein [Planctomycetota bacterium]REK23290.1 MAG: glycosyltransferase family 1 protein [Planctomycetota bacterium]REK30922.1 MAG: glycosyltransferase family 1 protein [Planctomycetota bacterium]
MLADRFAVRGSSRHTLNLAQRLPDFGVQPAICCADAHLIPEAQREGLEIRELPYLTSPLAGRIVQWQLARDLMRDPPDLIHVQQRKMLTVGRRLAYRLERPYVVSVQDYLGSNETLHFEWKWCRRIVAVSDSVRQELITRTEIPAERVSVIHSGVETAVDERSYDVLEPDQVPVIGTAGPLEAAKGLRYFVDAAAIVLRTHPTAEFLIAGAGPEESNLRRQVRDLGITEHVTFVPEEMDVGGSLLAMDIYVLPSLKQGLGTMMLEAMVRGRPVIATKSGGVYSVVSDNETGLLVPPRDSEMLADRIIELLDDPLRARRIGRAARDMVCTQFPVARMVERTAELYREVLKENRIESPEAVPVEG